jgi:aspartyl-tRNA(Asn)/glutamyl-tRNA(Gln) amidotransferase subunit B
MENKYIPVIGLEIHVELKTKSKMFCQCSADYFGKDPNTNTCPVCLGMPGALPVPNKQAVEWTILIGRALNCEINRISKFDRKHYFYPDLPKGYQISQYDEPIAVNGFVTIKTKNGDKKFRIHRVHLEEDTGKLMHSGDDTLIDFNRSSVPLVEIVTEPDFDNPDEVKQFLEELHTIITYLHVSDADMEKGSMRLEPNISVKLKTTEGLPNYKVEVKNINSFNFVKRAIEYEVKRHIELLEKGQTPPQETRGFNDNRMTTYSQRTKENAQDYRYFPDPDIPPLEFSEEFLEEIEKEMPELPSQKVERFEKEFGLKYQDAFIITRDKVIVEYFEKVINEFRKQNIPFKVDAPEQKLANFIINKKIDISLSIEDFIKKAVEMLKPRETDTKLLDEVVNKVVAANTKSVEDYKSGKQNAIMFLVGQVMREMKGQADANTVKEALVKKIAP